MSTVGHVESIVQQVNERYVRQGGEIETLRKQNADLIESNHEHKARLELEAKKREDLTQKIVKITDENWAKDLEIAHLNAQEAQLQNELKLLTEQNSRILLEAREVHLHEIEALQETNGTLNETLKRVQSELDSRSSQADAGAAEAEALNARLASATSEIRMAQEGLSDKQQELDRFRAESATRFKDEMQALVQTHAKEFAVREAEHSAQLDQASGLIAAFEQERDELRAVIRREEGRVREVSVHLEEARRRIGELEMQNQSERAELQNWRAQLALAEQCVTQNAEAVAAEKKALIRLAMKLAAELNTAATTHPLKDYTAVIEAELSSFQAKIKQLPAQMIDRVKVIEGFKQVVKKRDFLNSILAESQRQLADRARAVLAALSADEERAG